MNFYKHYIGDFQRDTNHLSLAERGAYLALMHHYYATEKPLPNDIDALCRVAGAVNKLERAAVIVAMRFFEPVESGLMHSRIEAELEKAGEISTTNRDIALAREAKRRAAKTPMQEQAHSTKRARSVPRTYHEQSTNHTPDSRLQTPLKPEVIHTESKTPSPEPEPETVCVTSPSERITPTNAGLCCKAIIDQGIPTGNPSHPVLLELIKAGATEQEFAHAAREAVGRGNPTFAYVIGTVRRQREQAAKLVLHKGRLPNKQEALEASNRAATEGWVPPELREVNRVYK